MAGHQPNYLPWLGFFDKMRRCDVFIIEDIVQFVYKEFQNRNRIKTPNGVQWLTVPVREGGKRKPISDVEIANDQNWAERHWLTLMHSYASAPYWKEYNNFFRDAYSQKWARLIDLNMHLIKGIMNFLDIDTKIVLASNLGVSGKKNDLLISQCKALGADTYLSGAGGKDYIDVERFGQEGLKVIFQDFQYPVYPQLWGEFVPNLSIVDYLFCACKNIR